MARRTEALHVTVGDDYVHRLEVTLDAAAMDLTGYTVTGSMERAGVTQAFTVDDSDADIGIILFTLSDTVTADLEAGLWRFSIHTDLSGLVSTWLSGSLVADETGAGADRTVIDRTDDATALVVETSGIPIGSGGGGAPSGPAGGVLAGTYPDPAFAVGMVTAPDFPDDVIFGIDDDGNVFFDTSGLGEGETTSFQPLDSDLTAIAELSTTSFGRSLLTLTTAAALRSTIAPTGTPSSTTFLRGDGNWTTVDLSGYQPLDSDLTAIAALASTSFGRSVLEAANAAALRTLAGLGTAATVNTGTSSGDIPLLSTGGRLDIARVASGTPDGTKFVRDDGTLVVPPAGSMASDILWDAAGDLAVGSGADIGARLAKGTKGQRLSVNSGATGLEWQSAGRLGGSYTGAATIIAETLPIWATVSNVAVLSLGRPSLTPVRLEAGDVITSISWLSATAGAAMTNQWFALCNEACVVLAVTADDTSTAWGTNTLKTLNLSAQYTITTPGIYRLACMVAGTTAPTMRAASPPAGMPDFTLKGNTGMTTPPSLGVDLNGAQTGAGGNIPYGHVS